MYANVLYNTLYIRTYGTVLYTYNTSDIIQYTGSVYYVQYGIIYYTVLYLYYVLSFPATVSDSCPTLSDSDSSVRTLAHRPTVRQYVIRQRPTVSDSRSDSPTVSDSLTVQPLLDCVRPHWLSDKLTLTDR